jgi:hypothetical protein
MVNARTWLTLFLVSFGTALATASCGSSDSGSPGSAGVTGANTPGGADGAVNGTAGTISGGLGAGASAGAVSTIGAGATGRAGSGGGLGGGSSVSTGTLGSMCASDADCAGGLSCLTPDSTDMGSGGPSFGMCTATCVSDANCGGFEIGAGCVDVGTPTAPKRFCFEACTLGGDAGVFNTKCQGRIDFACTDLSTNTITPDPFCLPRCRADLECGSGLFCDSRSGLCSITQALGDAVGTACDPSAATNKCRGICLRTSSTVATTGECAEFCSGFLPCMYTGQAPGGLCAGALSNVFGPLDFGYCEPNCKCTSDCKFTGDQCRAWAATEASLKTALGADGLCLANLTPPGDVELTCGAGGTGGGP